MGNERDQELSQDPTNAEQMSDSSDDNNKTEDDGNNLNDEDASCKKSNWGYNQSPSDLFGEILEDYEDNWDSKNPGVQPNTTTGKI